MSSRKEILMKRRQFLKMLGSSALAMPLAKSWAQQEPLKKRPNIILVVDDDLGWADLTLTGSKFYETPNIDRMAAQGVFFTDNYSCGPNCAPSRASLMTGLYTPRHGILTVNSSARGKESERKMVPVKNKTVLDSSFVTVAEQLQQDGYDTASMGKWHLGDNEQTSPTGQGFNHNVAGGKPGHPPTYFSPYRLPSLEDGPEGEYLTRRLTDEAVKWIGRDRENPFFLYLPFYTVHTPIQAPKDLVSKYKQKEPGDKHRNAEYAAMIEILDESIGRLMQKVDEMGQADNTCFIFISDNGGHGGVTSNAPLRGAKGMLYEGGIRVPMIVRWPGRVPAGVRDATPTIGVDLYPTLLELAELPMPGDIPLDGVSLAGLFEQKEKLPERSIFWHFPCYLKGGDKSNNDPHFRTRPAGAVRRGDWKLIEFFEDNRLELYNLADDMSEKSNLADTHTEKREQLHTELKAWRKTVEAKMPTAK
ncbi:MAG: sulfatase [Candidatus Sumerlaeota bacterium]